MLKTVIVDDEIHCLETIEHLIVEYCKEIEIIGKYNCPLKALPEIIKNKPDLLLLDIDMPHMDGIEFAKRLSNIDIIFITAYNQFAYDAFKANAIDFILKPIVVSELITAISKVSQRRNNDSELQRYQQLYNYIDQAKNSKIAIPTSKGIEYINKYEIIWAEASSNYCILHLNNDKKLTVSKTLGDIEALLNDPIFFRTHKSQLINLNFVVRYHIKDGGQIELSDGSKLLLARRKKDDFLESMSQLT